MSKLSQAMHLSNNYPDGFICNATTEHGELVLYEDHAEKETETIPCSCVKCLAHDNEFETGDPIATSRYSVDELIKMNLVGLYKPKTEFVFCIRKSLVESLGNLNGLSFDNLRLYQIYQLIQKPENVVYLPRQIAETSWEFKQIIPYIVFIHEDKVFSYKRGNTGEESRLHDLYSIGIGGHITSTDGCKESNPIDIYNSAILREVSEEVYLSSDFQNALVGVINDESTEVNRVHLGFVHFWHLSSEDVFGKHSSIIKGKFLPIKQIIQRSQEYEQWSSLILKQFSNLLSIAHSSWNSKELITKLD